MHISSSLLSRRTVFRQLFSHRAPNGHNSARRTIEKIRSFRFLNGKDHADVIVCAAYLEDESLFEFLRRLSKDPIHQNTMFVILALASSAVGTKVNASTETAGGILGSSVYKNMPVFDAPLLIAEIKKLLPSVPKLELERQSTDQSR